ncbi:MAG TPA: Crp/Fnr family transcriptional regulator [Sunxiuqinia sp.]|nr:Crp/Fnr family transcriptional regulator [Sunxiuqinia sp.]
MQNEENICVDCVFKSNATKTLADQEQAMLSCNHLTINFKKDDPVIQQGHYSSNIVYLRSGLAKIHIHGPYYEQIIKIVKAPRYLGLPTTFGNKVNQYSVTVVENSEVCFIDMSTFKSLLENNKKFANDIILDLCQYEMDSYRKCAQRTQKQSRGNLADVILDFADTFYESDEFNLPLSRDEIGNLIDTSRESVSRILTEFANDQIIEVKGRKIKILNKKSLKLISENG